MAKIWGEFTPPVRRRRPPARADREIPVAATVEYSMTTDIPAAYDSLADHYHLIFDDWELSVERQGRTLARGLRENCQIPDGARILDCACGIGTQSLGLAGQGFHVSGCDVSPKSIERAIREASRKGLDIQFSVASMLDLSCFADTRFEAVICVDNALPHLENPQQLIRAAEQIHGRLSTGGSFLASVRDYDSLFPKADRAGAIFLRRPGKAPDCVSGVGLVG